MKHSGWIVAWLLAGALVVGCSDASTGATAANGGGGGPANGGASSFTQPGAQDFGLFRQILDNGEIPAPSALDDVGFFAEHKLDYPAPGCGLDVCAHALLGVTENIFTHSSATVLQVGLNTPIDVSELERPPLDLVLALDVSGSVDGVPMESLRAGLVSMLDHLVEGDTVSLVTYSSTAKVVFEASGVDQASEMKKVFQGLEAGGSTNLFDGLFTAYGIAEAHREVGRQSRVILLSDGVATEGLQSTPKLVELATSFAAAGTGLTTIGIGTEFDVSVMRDLAEVGGGGFYFIEDPLAVKEVFTEEVDTFLVPAALDVTVELSLAESYKVLAVYGTNGWKGGSSGGRVEIPSLFLAGRTVADEPVNGERRGGGGAIMLVLGAEQTGTKSDDPFTVGVLQLTFTDPVTGEQHSQELTVENPNQPGEVPNGGFFSNKTVEKAFMMLSVYAGFEMASRLATDGDVASALGVLGALRPGVQSYLTESKDPDLADDMVYVDKFIKNLQKLGDASPVTVLPAPWPEQ